MTYIGNVKISRVQVCIATPSAAMAEANTTKLFPLAENRRIRYTTVSCDGVCGLVEEIRHRLLNWPFPQWNLFQFRDDKKTGKLRVNALSPACDRPSGAHSFVSDRVTLNQSASGKMDVRYAVINDSGALESRACLYRDAASLLELSVGRVAWLVVRCIRVLLGNFDAVLLGIPAMETERKQ